jgi:hypothetical protein
MLGIDHKQPYIIKVPGLLTPDECASLIAKYSGALKRDLIDAQLRMRDNQGHPATP